MRQADFKSRIKKIEIVNKVLADGWAQSIRICLEDIELTNENLLELRQFRPNEAVDVVIKPVQVTLFDAVGAVGGGDSAIGAGVGAVGTAVGAAAPKARAGAASKQRTAKDGGDGGEFITITEESAGKLPPGQVLQKFKV